MKIKRFLAVCLAAIMMVSAMAIPASAAGIAEEVMYARIYGGATVSSSSAQKSTTRPSLYYNALPASDDGWSAAGNEWVYFRGRDAIGTTQVTYVDHKNYDGYTLPENYLAYLSGYGSKGSFYKMAIEYDNNNPYEYVNLNVNWAP